MRAEYLYVFGHWTPGDQVANEKGYDQESLGFFRLAAGSEAEALEWGHELSRWYTSQVFGNDGEPHWDPKWFASWIELAPDSLMREKTATIPVVAAGEYPNFDQM